MTVPSPKAFPSILDGIRDSWKPRWFSGPGFAKVARVLTSVLAIFAIATPDRAHASIPTGSVILAEFSTPVLQGSILDPIPPHVSYYDNTQSAVYLISNSTDGTLAGTPPGQRQGSQLFWGTDPGISPNYSTILFFGRTAPADQTKPFDLGTIEFGNGTSLLQSLIFGATLTFYVGPAEPNAIGPGSLPIGSTTIGIETTDNLAVPGSEKHDADYLNFSGIAKESLNAFEGHEVTAELYGYITGDPVLTLTDIVLNPGQSGNGFIGDGQPIPFAVPEPRSAAMLGTVMLAGLCTWARRPRAARS